MRGLLVIVCLLVATSVDAQLFSRIRQHRQTCGISRVQSSCGVNRTDEVSDLMIRLHIIQQFGQEFQTINNKLDLIQEDTAYLRGAVEAQQQIQLQGSLLNAIIQQGGASRIQPAPQPQVQFIPFPQSSNSPRTRLAPDQPPTMISQRVDVQPPSTTLAPQPNIKIDVPQNGTQFVPPHPQVAQSPRMPSPMPPQSMSGIDLQTNQIRQFIPIISGVAVQ